MNRRPLTRLSTDPKDVSPLTPSHFIRPASIHSPTDASVRAVEQPEKEVLTSAWKRAQARIQSFWMRFLREFVTMLHGRQKWRTTKDDLKEGDLVLKVNENTQRSHWKL